MLLGIDLGTGSVKTLLLSRDGVVLGEAQAHYPVTAPQPGWAQTDPSAWWRSTARAVRGLVAGRAHEVEAVGLSGQMHGVVLCAAAGEPLRPAILWADGRSQVELPAYAALPDRLRHALGNPPASGMAGPTLAWLRQHEPEAYARARWALQPKDWLRLRLTGVAGTEPSDASATLLYDLAADGWALEVVEALGLRPDLLAPLSASARVAGTMTVGAARALGLRSGVPVATGAADVAAALIGSGLNEPGPVQLTVGSGAQIVTLVQDARPDATGRTHLFRTAAVHGYYAMAAMQNAGLALEWVRRTLGVTWKTAYREAFGVAPGAGGVTFVPYVTGERTPHFDPAASGSWRGLRLDHGRAHLLRAAFEGVAFSLREGLTALQDLGHDPDSLRLAGGGTLHPEWRQLLADVLGRPLLATDVPSASARGAALLAGMATGVFGGANEAGVAPAEPTPVAWPSTGTGPLEDAYRRYLDSYPAVGRR